MGPNTFIKLALASAVEETLNVVIQVKFPAVGNTGQAELQRAVYCGLHGRAGVLHVATATKKIVPSPEGLCHR